MASRELDDVVDAARKRAALETYVRNEAALRRTARRYSICADDADEALQRGLEILLRKAPSEDPRELIRWTQTVVKHEALAVRRERERILSGPAATRPDPEREDWTALIPAPSDGPDEQVVRREAIARSREALQALKPQELRALTLLAEGYSYLEIGEITGYSRTKINRCLAEGRERFRRIVAGSEDGSRCTEMGPLLSAFCDGEAGPQEVATVREHLRACPHCRATLRSYRAAPAAASALLPALPLQPSLLDRVHDALAELASRLTGRASEAAAHQAGSGALPGAGSAALAKAAAICVATVGGAACVAGGVVPVPLELGLGEPSAVQQAPTARPLLAEKTTAPDETDAVHHAPAPAPPPREPDHSSDERQQEAPADSEPASGTVEYTPPPAPEPAPAPVAEPPAEPTSAAADTGTAAGEFGP